MPDESVTISLRICRTRFTLQPSLQAHCTHSPIQDIRTSEECHKAHMARVSAAVAKPSLAWLCIICVAHSATAARVASCFHGKRRPHKLASPLLPGVEWRGQGAVGIARIAHSLRHACRAGRAGFLGCPLGAAVAAGQRATAAAVMTAVKEAEGLGALLAHGAFVVFHPDDASHSRGAGHLQGVDVLRRRGGGGGGVSLRASAGDGGARSARRRSSERAA